MPTPSSSFFDVWVIGPLLPPQHDPTKRAELLRRIEAVHRVDKLEGAQFVAGARLRLRRGVDQDAALRIVAELQGIGATVEVEANRPPDAAILALDQFHDAEPEPDAGIRLDENLMAKLQSLDGDETPPPIDRDARTKSESAGAKRAALASAEVTAPRLADGAISSVEVTSPHVPISSVEITSPIPIPSGEVTAPRELAISSIEVTSPQLDDTRFRPLSDSQPMELELERPAPPAPKPRPQPSAMMHAPDDATAPIDHGDEDAAEDVAPITTDSGWQPIPGKIAQGALRKNPPVRIAIGIVAGLALGWLFAQPYASRAERRVAELRAQADTERYRPVDEAQQRVRALDTEADDTASRGAIGMAVIWIVVGGGAFAAWWRFS